MIVVVGSPSGRHDGARIVAGGLAAGIAIEAARVGRRIEIVGRIGDDGAADAVLQDLARSGVGHVAILRDPARPTPIEGPSGGDPASSTAAPEVDGADVDLALRYLTDFQVIVLVEPIATSVLDVVARATEWAEAALIVAGAPETPTAGLSSRARVVSPDDGESPVAYVARVATLAVASDPTGA